MTSEAFCRLCAVKSENFINVFDSQTQKLNLPSKIKCCLQISVLPGDSLPKTICISCCEKVDDYYKYFTLCLKSQTSLVDIVKVSESIEEISSPKPLAETEVELKNGPSTINPQKPQAPSPCANRFRDTSCDTSTSLPQLDVAKTNEVDAFLQTPCPVRDESSDQDEEDDLFVFTESRVPVVTSWICTICNQSPGSLSALKSHYQEDHNEQPVFKCTLCSKIYSRYRSFARHLKLHGNPKRYSCEICGKSFSQKTVLQSHSTVHSEERPHVCTQCGKAFKQFSSLYLHSKCHLPDQVKPKFPCSLCPKEFSTKHTLDMHTKIHTGERNFICELCGKSFIAKGSLDYHMLTHSDSKPHSCAVCGKGFKTVRLLTKHSTLHTGVKPHQCDVCGKQFRERGALKEHNRIHTGAMPYSCEFCGRLFRFKGILTVHRRQHTGERPYSCTECSREFTNWANYNKHMKRRHKNVEPSSTSASQQQPAASPPVLGCYEPLIEIDSSAPFAESSESLYKLPEEHEDIYRSANYAWDHLSSVQPLHYYSQPTVQQSSSFERQQ